MESAADSEAVAALPWLPVNVGDSRLLAKAWFGETQYKVLLSDLTNVWEEEMSRDSIQSRAQDLNKRLRAPVQAFFAHLKTVASTCFCGLSGDQRTTANISLEFHSCYLTVKLKSELAGMPFHWEFRCTPAPVEVVSRQLVRPLLAITHVLQRQVGDLAALLVRKDAEIQDYKENGAVLSRGRLQTEPFEEETYHKNFITKSIPQMVMLQDCVEFDSRLQELYVAVTTVRNNKKRKHSTENNSSIADHFSLDPEHSTPEESSVPTGSIRSVSPGSNQTDIQQTIGKSQEADGEQNLIPAAAPSVRMTVRPKKKKAVGLFR
ncbi:non-homologous end-joining factor 1 [Hoplias malabaricus]|uniref:non-homologous end-joining factor 1 n=1 Tax=Hoplias malabaricus TaxID=27720 RepID=UPI003461E553